MSFPLLDPRKMKTTSMHSISEGELWPKDISPLFLWKTLLLGFLCHLSHALGMLVLKLLILY